MYKLMHQVVIMAVQHSISPVVEGLINNPSKNAIIALPKYNKNYPHIVILTNLGFRWSSKRTVE